MKTLNPLFPFPTQTHARVDRAEVRSLGEDQQRVDLNFRNLHDVLRELRKPLQDFRERGKIYRSFSAYTS